MINLVTASGRALGISLALLAGTHFAQGQAMRESLANDPIQNNRFIEQTAGSESRFTYQAAAQALHAVLDVDASPAFYVSNPFSPLTDAANASFSVRFRLESAEDQNHPAAFIGLLTDRHLGDFGDGLVLVLSLVNGLPVVNANVECFDRTFSGGGVPLESQADYLAVGRYRADIRQFAIEVFSGAGLTNLVGFSVVSVPEDTTFAVNRLGLQNAGARGIDSASGSITLTVDDLFAPADPIRRISIGDVTVVEGDGGTTNALLTLQLTTASSLPVSVNFATADGTAKAGLDYQARSGTVTFSPGATSTTVAVPILGDLVPEPTETFSVTLTNPVDATLLKGAGLCTILDNDPLPVLSISDAAVLEGDSGSANAEFAVTLSHPSGQTVTVNYATADGSANQASGDYVQTAGTLTFLPGETNWRLNVAVKGDTTPEGDEVFWVNLTSPIHANLGRAQGRGTIFDDDTAPRLSVNDVRVLEGNSGFTLALFTVSLSRASTVPVTVAYSAASGTATVGSDLLAASGTLTLPPGSASTNFTVRIVGDTSPELDETFVVQLSNAQNAEIAKATGIGTIENDDAFPEVSIDDASVLEGDTGTRSLVFPVRLSFAIDQPVSVRYSTADLTASSPADYLPQSGTIVIPAGASISSLSIPIVGDVLNESDETVTVDLSNPAMAALGRARAMGTILNDDPVPLLTVADAAVLEGDSGSTNVVLVIRLSSASGQVVSVRYQAVDETAQAGMDYVATSGTVTFSPGATAQPISVTVLGDTLFEPDQTFLLTLANASNAALPGRPARVTIRNDDALPGLSIDDAEAIETAGGSTAEFSVTLSKPSLEGPVTVRFATADGTAAAPGDYAATSRTLSFAPGETQISVSVPIQDDLLFEAPEFFFANLSDPDNAEVRRAQGRATIRDNDVRPRLSVRDAQVLEGDAGTNQLAFAVQLDAPSGLPVTAEFATSNGTATAESGDYRPAAGRIEFAPGVTNLTVHVVVNGDMTPEPDETVHLDFSAPVNATAGRLGALGTILDDDTKKLTISNVTVAEGPAGTSTNAIFSVRLNKPSPEIITVQYSTANGTAVANEDYLPASGLVTFPPGATAQELVVVVLGDDVFEADETFLVNLSEATNAVLELAQGVGTIRDDDDAVVIVPAGMNLVSEDCAPPNGAIDPGETVTVSLALANVGTLPSATVVGRLLVTPGITPLSAPQTYGVLAAKGDAVGRTFNFRADGECGQALSAVLEIQNGGTNFGTAVFAFRLGTNSAGQVFCCQSTDIAVAALASTNSVVINHEVTCSISVTNRGPRIAHDVRLTNVWQAPVTFLALNTSQGAWTDQGQSAVCAIGSLAPGGSATLQVKLAPQQVGPLIGVFYAKAAEHDPLASNNTATLAAMVNPPPGLSIGNVTVVEGDAGVTNAIFTIHLSPATGREVRVDYATLDGSARAAEDYEPAQGTLTILPGTTTATVAVRVLGDTIVEPDETFSVRLSEPVNAVLATEQITGTALILDDDVPLLTVEDASVREPGAGSQTHALFAVRLSPAPQRAVSLDFFTTDGTARSPDDYVPVSSRLALAPGVTSTNLAVEILGDLLSEPDETFFLTLTNTVGARLDRPQAKATIIDNAGSAIPGISITGASVLEGPARTTTNAVFRLSLSRASALTVQVNYTTANGSAIGGSDYVITSGTVHFAPGQTNALVLVLVNGDDLPEPAEHFFVRLSEPVNGVIAVGQAEGTIENDEYLPHLLAGGTELVLENCLPPNRALDPHETVTVNFGLLNRGLGPTTNLAATLRTSANFRVLSGPQNYGILQPNAPAAFRPFTFALDGICGQQYTAELELRDGAVLVGTLPFALTLGTSTDGQPSCCSSADISITMLAVPEPAALLSPLAYHIAITNHGPSVATSLLLTNRFTAPVQFLSSGPHSCSASETELVCSLGDLAPGQGRTYTNVVLPTTLGSLINIAVVGGEENDPVPANNVAIVASTVSPPTGLSVSDVRVAEGDQDHAMSFEVRLWPQRNYPVSVEFTLVDGTAIAGQDYISKTGTLTFPPGVTATNLSVIIKGDLADEPDETFFVILRNPVNAALARGQAVGTILDDDLPALAISDVAVNVGTNALAWAVLTVSLSSAATQEIEVDCFTSNGSATAGTDYEAQRQTLNFPPGTRTLQVRIPIAGNTADEREEEFFVHLANPRNATLADDLGVVTITDEAPVDLAVGNASVWEGNAGFTNLTFSVTLRKPIEHTVTVDFFTLDVTALAGSDYVSTNGTIVFPPGTVERQVSVRVIGDLIAEPHETLSLNLTNALNGVIRNSRGIGTIMDDEAEPCLSIADTTVAEGDGSSSALLIVRLSGPSSETIRVEVLAPECQSAPVQSIGAAPHAVTFAPGQTERTLALPILGDRIYEPDETCLVLLTNAQNAAICDGQAVLTIINDDPLPGLEISDVTVTEGNSGSTAAQFTVTLAGATSQIVTVQFSTADGSAIAGSDYAARSGMLSFPPGTAAASLTVQVNGDLLVEPNETFFVRLSQPVNAALFRNQATGTILNDDTAAQPDCPAVVILATPGHQTCFEPFAPIHLTATPDEASAAIVQMEFYSGSSLIGIDTASPFEIVWEGVPVGDYCLSARAVCKSGQSVRSDAMCIGVTQSGAAVAIVQNFADPEINSMREYLLELGYCARVFDQDEITAEALREFRLVIWNDLGEEGLSDATVQILAQVFDEGIPLYLIGDRLISSAAGLSLSNRPIWVDLLHLSSLGRAAVPQSLAFSMESEDRQPGAVLSGRFAEYQTVAYTNTVDFGQAADGAASLAFAGGADFFVQYPAIDFSSAGETRSISQAFRVRTGAGEESLAARKALFQNAICWLFRCSFCPFTRLVLNHAGAPENVHVGDEFTFDLLLGNTGECIASGTMVTNQLPAGLALVGAAYNQGIGVDYQPSTRTLLWRVGSLIGGYENSAILSVTVRALQPGAFRNSACARAAVERVSDANCTGFDLQIQGSAQPEPPSLQVLRSGSGLVQLQLRGQSGSAYQIQRSSDLSTWLPWTNAPGPLFFIDLPDVFLPASKSRFFRAR